jgi:hypothetical protein
MKVFPQSRDFLVPLGFPNRKPLFDGDFCSFQIGFKLNHQGSGFEGDNLSHEEDTNFLKSSSSNHT